MNLLLKMNGSNKNSLIDKKPFSSKKSKMNRFCIGWFYHIIEMSAKKEPWLSFDKWHQLFWEFVCQWTLKFRNYIYLIFKRRKRPHTIMISLLLLDINTFFFFFLFALLNICIIRFIHSRTIIIIDAYFEGLFVYLPKYFRENGLWSPSTENNSPFLPNIGHCALVN